MERPYLVLEWNDDRTDASGWVVVHNFVKGYASGGTRMHPSVTRQEVERLARTMAYKYVASECVTTGGCKAGIAYDYKAPDAKEVLRRFLTAMKPYLLSGVSLGGDLGVTFEDVLDIMKELQVELVTPEMKRDPSIMAGLDAFHRLLGESVDGFPLNDAVTGYGTAFAADEAWKCKGGAPGAKVVIQGFGCVGASCAYKLHRMGYRIVGISDANLLVVCEEGLDVPALVSRRQRHGEMAREAFESNYTVRPNTEWLDVDCDILIPAALDDTIHAGNACQVKAGLIVEGANIPISPEGDEIIKRRGIDVVNDFVANLGAIRFYDAVIFGTVRSGAQEVMDDIERLCRKNTANLFAEALKQGVYQREAADVMFRPGSRHEEAESP